jgi:hypothetical protein
VVISSSRADHHDQENQHMNRFRKAVVSAALIGTTLTGGAIGATMVNSTANAQTATTSASPTTSSSTAPAGARDPAKGGHQANGVTETLLTGSTKTTVEAAAKAAVPGGTIERVENDAEGATYEAHMTKADGSHVTVKLDAGFKVTGIETGGPHP